MRRHTNTEIQNENTTHSNLNEFSVHVSLHRQHNRHLLSGLQINSAIFYTWIYAIKVPPSNKYRKNNHTLHQENVIILSISRVCAIC